MRRCQIPLLALIAAAPTLALAQTTLRDGAVSKPAEGAPPVGALPPWLKVGGQLRARAEAYSGGGFRPDNSDQYVLTRVLLHARVQPTRLTSLFVEGMDARGPWKNKAPSGAPFRDHADLRQLYLQIGADTNPATLRAGRLELAFGDGRLVGSLPWANTLRTFDGGRTTFAGKGYRVDAFGASVVRVEQDKLDKNIPGNNFYGVYGALSRLVPGASLEPFVFWRRQSGLTSEQGVRGTTNFGTYGVRANGKLPSNFDYDAQMALQSGSLGDESIGLYAFDAFGDEYTAADYINEVKRVSSKTDTYSSVTMGFFLSALLAGDGMRQLGDHFTRPAGPFLPDCQPSTTGHRGTRIRPTTRRARSTSSTPPATTSTASPTSSAGRTCDTFVAASTW